MAKQLFGTDGIRGVAGQYPLDDATVFAAGQALGELVRGLDPHSAVIVGIDTRESGPRLAELVAGGLERAGAAAAFAGVIPTPGLAYLTTACRFAAGVMISASHNPYEDNGIKIFSHSGYKFPDEQEERLEERIDALRDRVPERKALAADAELIERYVDHLARCWADGPIPPLRVVVDCANGAAFDVAPRLFGRLGFRAQFIANEPDGRNINRDVGSLHLSCVRSAVIETRADLGVAFDGDADRALFVSASGREINGDGVLWMAARYFGVSQVVTTTMANLGLERALAEGGVATARTPVGDKYVLEEMIRRDAELGGEQSGHIIFRRYATTGDGLLTALKVIEILAATGRTIDELTADLPIYPQIIRNVRVRARTPLDSVPDVWNAIQAEQRALDGRGRIVVRYSGTEPLLRVMVEAETPEEVELHAGRLVRVITEQLGA